MDVATSAFLQDLMTDLHTDEGQRLFVYDDYDGNKIVRGSVVKGNPTIGIGRCLSTRGITELEANTLLANDCIATLDACQRVFTWFHTLDTVRQRAICNMAFQMGVAGVAEFTNMIMYLQKQDWHNAAAAMLDSAWAKETPARAEHVAIMIKTGAELV